MNHFHKKLILMPKEPLIQEMKQTKPKENKTDNVPFYSRINRIPSTFSLQIVLPNDGE
mgnify:CR=1 FL=1